MVYQDCQGEPTEYDQTVIINHTTRSPYNFTHFSKIYDVSEKKGKVILYKSVSSDLTDFYTGRVKYEIGKEVVCPDWDDNIDRECGGGLHLSPSIDHCKLFNTGRYLKVEVDVADILVHPSPQYPYKIRCSKCKVLEEIKE